MLPLQLTPQLPRMDFSLGITSLVIINMPTDGESLVMNKQTQRLVAEVGGQCVVGLEDKELGRLFEEGGQV